MTKIAASISAALIIFTAHSNAASFDCTKAAAPIETLICSTQKTSELDQQLGDVYKKVNSAAVDKDLLKQQQREWLKNIRNACSTTECLVSTYEARIQALNSNIPNPEKSAIVAKGKPNFTIAEGDGRTICKEYVKLLNRTPKEDLRPCKLPDLTGSPIQPVPFKPLTGEALKAMDKIVYEQGGGGEHLDWEQRWPEREKEYAQGYHQLAEAYWDLDKDGKPDQIIQESIMWSSCSFVNVGPIEKMATILEQSWASLSQNQQLAISQNTGYKKMFSLIKDGKLSFVDAENFVTIGADYYSVDQGDLDRRDSTDDWADYNWVEIWSVQPTIDEKYRIYRMTSSMCKFQFNK